MSRFLIVGAGRQGIAVGYYLAKFYKAQRIVFVDTLFERSLNAVSSLKKMLKGGKNSVNIENADVEKFYKKISRFAKNFDVMIGAIPSEYAFPLAFCAAENGISYCDYGPNTDTVRAQLGLGDIARKNGVTIIPNNGIGPGLNNIIAVGGSREFDCDTVKMFVGGIPEDKNCNPLGYQAAFLNLLDGYVGETTVLENGKLKKISLPAGLEDFYFSGGMLEAFFTDVGTELTAEFLKKDGRVKNFFEKTLRWPGHFIFLRQLECVGLLKKEKCQIDGVSASPFSVTKHCFDNMQRVEKDVLIFCVFFEKEFTQKALVKMVVRYDPDTGFTAMQKATSANTAIIAWLLAEKKIPSGAYLPEDIINKMYGWRFIVSELWSMGFTIKIEETPSR